MRCGCVYFFNLLKTSTVNTWQWTLQIHGSRNCWNIVGAHLQWLWLWQTVQHLIQIIRSGVILFKWSRLEWRHTYLHGDCWFVVTKIAVNGFFKVYLLNTYFVSDGIFIVQMVLNYRHIDHDHLKLNNYRSAAFYKLKFLLICTCLHHAQRT